MTTDSTLTVAHTLAGLPVSDMGRAEDWYVKLFGKPADAAPMDILRDFRMSELATVQLVLDPDHAGGGLLTLDVSSIDDAVAWYPGSWPTPSARRHHLAHRVEYVRVTVRTNPSAVVTRAAAAARAVGPSRGQVRGRGHPRGDREVHGGIVG